MPRISYKSFFARTSFTVAPILHLAEIENLREDEDNETDSECEDEDSGSESATQEIDFG
jgi:hypothetical protein